MGDKIDNNIKKNQDDIHYVSEGMTDNSFEVILDFMKRIEVRIDKLEKQITHFECTVTKEIEQEKNKRIKSEMDSMWEEYNRELEDTLNNSFLHIDEMWEEHNKIYCNDNVNDKGYSFKKIGSLFDYRSLFPRKEDKNVESMKNSVLDQYTEDDLE